MRFVKLAGKLAKFAILSPNARETGHTFHVMATTGKSNMAYTPGRIDSNESPWTIVLYCAFSAECSAGIGQ